MGNVQVASGMASPSSNAGESTALDTTSPIVYGTITLTWTTPSDTTSGTPATAITVSHTPSQAEASTTTAPSPTSEASRSSATSSAQTTSGSSLVQSSGQQGQAAVPSSPVSFGQGASTPTDAPPSLAAPVGVTISLPDSSLTYLTTSAIQTATSAVMTNTTGIIQTSLETSGNPSVNPFPTSVVNATSTLSLLDTATLSNVAPTATAGITSMGVSDIFRPMATDAPPSQIQSRSDHPVPPKGVQPQYRKLETNKFYANLFLENQDQPVYTFPYSLQWQPGAGQSKSYGMAISHTERAQFAQGQNNSAGAWSFFASPVGIQSLVLSATQLGPGTRLTTDSIDGFSANVNLIAPGSSDPTLTLPLVQGMAFITGRYNNATPVIQSGVGINSVTYIPNVGDGSTFKYRIAVADTFTWLAYITPQSSSYDPNTFTLVDGLIQGKSGFNGYIQIAKVPANTPDAEAVYDSAAGAYPLWASVFGSVDGTTGTYGLSWEKQGVQSQSLLMFALPHHVQSFANSTRANLVDVQLMSTTKGLATAVRADSWTLIENDLPVSMDFAPWHSGQGSLKTVSASAASLINAAGAAELQQDMAKQCILDSMYYSGKALAKFAGIIYTLHDIGGDIALALTGLQLLEKNFAVFVNNDQPFPLVYDEVWGGAVSDGSYPDVTNNSGVDFGNSYYNDHHFHYGYFVYAAAVIAYLDPTWLANGTNKAWVDMLVRDYSNPSYEDPYFPFSRNFDWYHGHSWAKGLFASTDGKDQESSSEDTMASYGLKMWGHITGDTAMEARGNLMLAVQARSLSNYYLYTSDNTVEPAGFIPNKAAGIMFENKIDHTTYFGGNTEYIEGIHMIPIMPFSTLTRKPDFVRQEWDTYFTSYATTVQSGWRGILEANHGLIDPQASYDFFSNATGNFNVGLLDGGASQTWYLAMAAGLLNSPAVVQSLNTRSETAQEKRYVDGELVPCDESNEQDMLDGKLTMYGELPQRREVEQEEEEQVSTLSTLTRKNIGNEDGYIANEQQDRRSGES